MSSVLRPFTIIKKSNVEIIDNNNSAEVTKEVVENIVAQIDSTPVVEAIQNTQEEVITEAPPSTEIDSKNEEKISSVLQELLDRKIDKTIESAEAVLSQVEAPVSPVAVNEPQDNSHEIKMAEEVNSLATEQTPLTEDTVDQILAQSHTETVHGTSFAAQDISIEQEQVMSVESSVPQQVTTVTGQEIHLPVEQQELLPSTSVREEAVALTQVSSLPTIGQGNAILINVVPQEIIPITGAGEGVITVSNPVPVVAVAEQKVHWFDRLFGSVPPESAQAV